MPTSPLDTSDGTDRVTVIANPARGTALLIYDPLGTLVTAASVPRPVATLYIKASPWNRTGVCPFAWQLTPGSLLPRALRWSTATLTIICSRSVAMAAGDSDWNTGEPQSPYLVVIRVQDSALVPLLGSRVIPSNAIRGEYPWWTARGDQFPPISLWARGGRATNWDATVRTFSTGVDFSDDLGEWGLTVSVPALSRGGFAYEIYFPSSTGFFIRVVAWTNVKVEGFITIGDDGGLSDLTVELAVVDRLTQVPPQGATLDPNKFDFKVVNLNQRLSRAYRQQVTVLELAAGLNPVVGCLYDVTNAVVVALTGHTVWGETKEISGIDIAMIGIGAALAAPGFASLSKSLANAARKRLPSKLATAFDPAMSHASREAMDPRVRVVIEKLTEDEQQSLTRAFDAFANETATSLDVINIFTKTVAARIGTATEVERVFIDLFSQDVNSFRVAELAEGYAKYLSKNGKLSPLAWAAKQTTSGGFTDILVRVIGPDFRKILGLIEKSNRILVVSEDALNVFDRVGGVPHFYRDLKNVVKGFGNLFEVDHLIEKRFLSAPQWEDVIHQSDFMSIVVARDSQVARQIPGYKGYSHLEKTLLMRELIPHGSEAFYSAQQVWDAHAFTLISLGLEKEIVAGPFKRDFEFLIKASNLEGKQSVNFRLDQVEADFTAARKWPRFVTKK